MTTSPSHQPRPGSTPSAQAQVVILIGTMLLVGFYFLIRYQGRWAENDTAAFTTLSQAIFDSRQLLSGEEVYSNGYAYQSFLVFLAHSTGLDIRQIQIYLAPLLAAWVVLPAWLAYRELTASPKVASLATLILLIQPEFLFPILRGSHEKFTRGLMFFALFLLARSIRSQKNFRLFASFVLLFYLAAYSLITLNNLMAFSFIFAIAISLVLYGAVSWRDRLVEIASLPLVKRLVIVVGSLLIIAFIFTFYAYPPAQEQLRLMQSIQDRLSSMFLQVEEVRTNPYAVINSGWISSEVYLLISLSNWIILGASSLIWLWQTYNWFFKKHLPSQPEKLLWAIFGSFAAQGALSIAADLSGSIAGNLQHRMFPSFAMLAAPLTARWLVERLPQLPARRKLAWSSLGLLLTLLGLLSVVKATNEPLLSNYWIFYQPEEIAALNWAVEKHQAAWIWTDFNERLVTAYQTLSGPAPNRNTFDIAFAKRTTESYLISNLTRFRSERLGIPLPTQADSLRIYDNGEAAIYHRRPVTSFQR